VAGVQVISASGTSESNCPRTEDAKERKPVRSCRRFLPGPLANRRDRRRGERLARYRTPARHTVVDSALQITADSVIYTIAGADYGGNVVGPQRRRLDWQ
jgi:hypothetical protein